MVTYKAITLKCIRELEDAGIDISYTYNTDSHRYYVFHDGDFVCELESAFEVKNLFLTFTALLGASK